MDTTPASVTRELMLELIDACGSSTEVAARLCYDRTDPFAVSAVFVTGKTPVQWVFARELLEEGLYEPCGEGDVHVWPCLDPRGHAVTVIELASPDGQALLQARSDELGEFLRRTQELVPSGTEDSHLDLDALVSELLP